MIDPDRPGLEAADDAPPRPSIVIMGVSGSGKTTVGILVAALLGVPFHDADDLHPRRNVAKMKAGVPLTDEDRSPWLESLGGLLAAESRRGVGSVIACSALKRAYRERIAEAAAVPLLFVHLDGDRPTLEQRLRERKGHFMPPSLLDSQLQALEPLGDDEPGFRVVLAAPAGDIAAHVVARCRRSELLHSP